MISNRYISHLSSKSNPTVQEMLFSITLSKKKDIIFKNIKIFIFNLSMWLTGVWNNPNSVKAGYYILLVISIMESKKQFIQANFTMLTKCPWKTLFPVLINSCNCSDFSI